MIRQTLHIRQDVARLQLRHRCEVCDRSFNTQRDLRIPKSRKGSWADKLVSRDKCKNTVEHNKTNYSSRMDQRDMEVLPYTSMYLGVQLAVEGTIDFKVKCHICKAEAKTINSR